MSSDQMERRLLEATRRGNIDELKDLIGSNELILEGMALKEAGHTLLHVACLGGHLDVVEELLRHVPKFAEKVDQDGFSPLHIAAARGDVKIAMELLKVGTHLCFVEGRERRIPLHYAVIHGEVEVMKILLSTSPESVEKTTAREETVLHLAVKNNRPKVLDLLVKHLKEHTKEHMINLKDHEGNTALHLAATSKNFEVVDNLLRGHGLDKVVEVNTPNKSGLTPLDVATPSQMGAGDRELKEIFVEKGAEHGPTRPVSGEDDDIKAGNDHQSNREPVSGEDDDIEVGNDHQSNREPVSNAPQPLSRSTSQKLNQDGKEPWVDVRNALLVVAALITNATYQSVLQPPTIVEHDKVYTTSMGSVNKLNTVTYGGGLVYILFLGGNTFGFLVSVQMIIYLTQDLAVKRPLMLSLIAMVLTYFSFTLSLLITSARGVATATVLNVLPLMIAIFLLLMQRWLAKVLDIFLGQLFQNKFFNDLYQRN